jgi:hypothetical protein
MKKWFISIGVLAALLWSAAVVKAQTVLMLVLVIGAAMFASGTVIWLYAQNETQVHIRWVVVEAGTIGGPWTPVLTNKAIIGPQVFKDFPVAYVYTTNTHRWYRARLAKDDEIPQNFVAPLPPANGEIQPVIYSDAELIEIRDRLNRKYYPNATAK